MGNNNKIFKCNIFRTISNAVYDTRKLPLKAKKKIECGMFSMHATFTRIVENAEI